MPRNRSRSARLVVALLLLSAACATDPTGPVEPEATAGAPSLASSLLPGVCNADLDETTLTGWTRVWRDDFTGEYAKGASAAGLANWNLWSGGAWNDELQLYQGDSNLSLSGGVLSIAAERETVTGVTNPYDATLRTYGFTSGRIESKALFGAGVTAPKVRLAARLKLPSGFGMWPAFWSYGDPWPTQGEIDILEARGNIPGQYQTAYYYGRRSGVNLVRNSAVVLTTNPNLSSCWHVYEVIWTRDALTFLLDGLVVEVKTGGYVSSLYRKQEKITLNLAVGGVFFPGIDPGLITLGTLQADWVKVFTSK